MKSLENFGVCELKKLEVKEINGGNIWGRLVRAGIAALAALHDQVCDGEGRCEMSLTPNQSADYYKYRAM
ncbi:hypothetical protein Murru_3093 [Allomuricauda ruestringensis DSM 13258]|uniref:Uncharacterized protein n=1 Tax=Allomuricauda ruestringensis (strain DSM 13258 / CIP 107369 / LMG 19739 / B1) TaxID=886377 RepID=G2PKR8_ALLRU|nr:hypothetical protein [Allomuricauda ruestringensis]AEM72114.1 hypothetical protein Murru_3093 [Allomuricauda ruestringensis DSM 13258]